jgi:hypothetical protein
MLNNKINCILLLLLDKKLRLHYHRVYNNGNLVDRKIRVKSSARKLEEI